MRANVWKPFVVIGMLAAAMLACNYITSRVGTKSDPSLLKDDFSNKSSGWGTGTDADSSVEYANGGLHMQIFKPNFFTWSNPDRESYQDVHLEVTVKNKSSNKRVGFGLMCNQQVTDSSYYYFAVTSDGEYVIGKSAVAHEDVFLTNNNKWAPSKLIAKNAPTYRLGADCDRGNLRLYVDGKKVDSANDTTYSKGGVGLFLWSGDNPSGEVTYDDFVMKAMGAGGK
jgi:hypothetical protein